MLIANRRAVKAQSLTIDIPTTGIPGCAQHTAFVTYSEAKSTRLLENAHVICLHTHSTCGKLSAVLGSIRSKLWKPHASCAFTPFDRWQTFSSLSIDTLKTFDIPTISFVDMPKVFNQTRLLLGQKAQNHRIASVVQARVQNRESEIAIRPDP